MGSTNTQILGQTDLFLLMGKFNGLATTKWEVLSFEPVIRCCTGLVLREKWLTLEYLKAQDDE